MQTDVCEAQLTRGNNNENISDKHNNENALAGRLFSEIVEHLTTW